MKFKSILVCIAAAHISAVFASSVPVGVTIKAENCPAGTVLVINDVETGLFVDSRGKLTTTVSGLAGYTITAQMHNVNTGQSFELISTPAAMNVRINLVCNGISFISGR